MDKITEHEQRMYDHYKAIEAENYHLKNQLKNKNKENIKLRKQNANLVKKVCKQNQDKKPRFRNNGKAGK